MIPLCYSCLRYATLPYAHDCPELIKLSQNRAATIKMKGNVCKAFISKKNTLRGWDV